MKKRLAALILAAGMAFPAVPVNAVAVAPENAERVWCVYNTGTGEHLYTNSETEKNNLVSAGWRDEDLAWLGSTAGDPIYRVYNPNARGGDHYYTMDKAEAEKLVALGWRWDNNGQPVLHSGGDYDVYVAYNPNAVSGSHYYTADKTEHDSLLSQGWKYGAVAWKVVLPQ